MILQPSNVMELSQALAAASARRAPVASVDLHALNRIVRHSPEDMTVTVEAGLPLASLQTQLARAGQWLPVDPPHAERLTLGALLDTDASGPRRFGCGTVRDYLLGLTVVLADGRVIHSGGRVVKNVAGYDLLKLFIGARGTLGVIVEATFKLLPRPAAEEFVQARRASLADADTLIESVLRSEVTPVVLDLHNLDAHGNADDSYHVVLGFAGTREEVDWQLAQVGALGISEPAGLDHEINFHSESAGPPPVHCSVLPSRLGEMLRELGRVPFVARAGNGVILHRGRKPAPAPPATAGLARRIKETFDPNRLFPELTV